MSRPKSLTPVWDTSWYIEQEKRIRESAAEVAVLRAEMQATFDPGFIYVVEFESYVIKAGKTANPAARLGAHAKAGLIRRTWVSDHHLQCGLAERELLAYCRRVGKLHGGKEYFRDISFETARQYAELVVRGRKLDDEREDVAEALRVMEQIGIARALDKDWSDLHADPEALAVYERRVANSRRDLIAAGFLSAT